MSISSGLRHTIVVVVTLLTVLSPAVAPASAALATDPGSEAVTSEVASTPTASVDTGGTVSPRISNSNGEVVNVSDNVSVWQRAPFAVNVVEDPSEVYIGIPDISFTLNNTGNLNYVEEQLSIYNKNTQINVELKEDIANADGTVNFNGQNVTTVVVYLEDNTSIPSKPSGIGELLNGDRNTSSRIVNQGEYQEFQNIQFTPSRSGRYVLLSLAHEDENTTITGDTSSLGEIDIQGKTTIVGASVLPVREDDSEVSVATQSGGTGANITFDVNTESTFGDEQVSHTVIVADEDELTTFQSETVVIEDGEISRVETTINDTTGVTRVEDGAEIFGASPGATRFTGTTDFTSLAENAIGSNKVVRIRNNTVNASVTSVVTDPSTTLDVGTLQEWAPKEYTYIYLATAKNGTTTVAKRGTVSLKQGVQLNVTPNRTDPIAGDSVRFNVTRENTGNRTNATLTVDGEQATVSFEGTEATASVPVADRDRVELSASLDTGIATAMTYRAELPVERTGDGVRALTPELEVCRDDSRCGGEAGYVPGIYGEDVAINATIQP